MPEITMFTLLLAITAISAVAVVTMFVQSHLKFKKRVRMFTSLVARIKAGESLLQSDFDSLPKCDQDVLKSLQCK